ncbi:hypothetical protein AB9M62_30275 [Bacillales bacterium AN1005]
MSQGAATNAWARASSQALAPDHGSSCDCTPASWSCVASASVPAIACGITKPGVASNGIQPAPGKYTSTQE